MGSEHQEQRLNQVRTLPTLKASLSLASAFQAVCTKIQCPSEDTVFSEGSSRVALAALCAEII